MVNKSDVGFASAADDRLAVAHLSQKRPGIEVAFWALNVNALPVED